MQIENNSLLITGLKAFGLNKKEAAVYLAGLHIGPATAIELGRRAKLPRTTIYSILEKQIQEGLFHQGKRKKHTVYTAESPQTLEKIFQERQQSFKEISGELEKIHNLTFNKANTTILEGTDGFKQLWKDIFYSGMKEYRLISSGQNMLEYVHEPYLMKHIIAERIKLGIKSRQLIAESRDNKKIIARDPKELRESRFFPYGSETPASVIIYGEKIAHITTRHENVMINIISGDIAITYRTMFDLLWQYAKNPYVDEVK